MTPEERAVINAAIELRQRVPGHDIHQKIAFDEAVWQLITTCPQCNAGGHACPGDGNPIGHGDRDCGEHDGDTSPEVDYATVMELEGGNNQPQWITRTWEDVRRGDRVRLPGTEHVAEVESVTIIGHLMHPNDHGATQWRSIEVRLAGRDGLLSMNPAGPIEIELTASELASIEALGGWDNRVRMERS